ncbi:LPXTG cell wall anchor domain-containing protein [Streptococcus saliviloxodontae]
MSESVSESLSESVSEITSDSSHHLSTSATPNAKHSSKLPRTGEEESRLAGYLGAGLLFASLFARKRKKDEGNED